MERRSISADRIAIIRRTAGRWRPVIIRVTQDEPDVVSVQRVVKLLAAEGWLQHFKRVDDLGQDDRWAGLCFQQLANLAVASHHALRASTTGRPAHDVSYGGPAGPALSRTIPASPNSS